MTAADIRKHRNSIASNIDGWRRLDFEWLSEHLKIEINHEMSPVVVRRVVEARIGEMSVKDHDEVPTDVWEYLASIRLLGKFEKWHERVDRTTIHPMKLKKVSRDCISMSPVGATIESFYNALVTNKSWKALSERNEVTITCHKDQLVIRGNCLYAWSEKQLSDIFLTFERVGELFGSN